MGSLGMITLAVKRVTRQEITRYYDCNVLLEYFVLPLTQLFLPSWIKGGFPYLGNFQFIGC